MIESIRGGQLGSIDSAELSFSPGLSVITGETGAGKSMLLTSLDWLLGAKADAALVPVGQDKAVVEGTFIVDEEAAAVVREAGGEVEEGTVEVARIVPATARSRAHLGGRTVPAAVLAQLGERLVSVHGQATQLRLRSEKAQREALDSFGGAAHQAALRDYLQAWEDWKSAQSQYRDWEENTAARAQRMQALREVLEEFEKLDPQGGEFDQLASQIAKLSNVESLRENLAAALMALSSPDMDYPGASDQVIVAARALEKAAQEDPALEEVFNSIESSRYALAEAVRDIEAYLQDLAADPQLLQENLSRRAALNDLGRKVGVDPNDLDRAWQSAAEELRSISGGEEKLAELRRLLDESHAALLDAAQLLHLRRQETAAALEKGINRELSGLDMKATKVSIALENQEAAAHGGDRVQFMLQPHPKSAILPLSQAASGGELSRIMLALEVTLAGTKTGGGPGAPRRTFVFDEVDAGIGGQAGIEVGRRLQALSGDYQVIVVTHLAQVAAFAQTQIQVEKVQGHSKLRVLDASQRREELARMISGNKVTKTALEHADELLRQANVGQFEA